MTDDNFENFLQRSARDYNAPPPTPRDAMWARIEAERRHRTESVAAHGARTHRWLMLGAAIAAMLLVGIGIGYVWRGTMDSHMVAEHRGGSSDSAGQRLAGVASESGDSGARDSDPRAEGGDSATARPEHQLPQRSPLAEGTRLAAVPPAAGSSGSEPREPHVSPFTPRSTPESSRASAADRRASAAYGALTAEHLGHVEVLLTTFRAESQQGKVDPQISSWAGDLLGTTRLLLDSPGASDPRLHKLLGDLEIVLTQITQLAVEKESSKDDLQLIDQSLRSHDVMTRIRGATPVGGSALPIGT